MIELLLQADQAMAVGFLDQAERLYRQAVSADPGNAIAVVGLARVALERGDERTAHSLAAAALGIDPENLQAQRVASRTADVLVARGEALPAPAAEFTVNGQVGGARAARAASYPPGQPSPPGAPPTPAPQRRRGLIRRLLGGR